MLAVLAGGALLILPPAVSAQEEVTSAIRRYKQYEFSTGYYEEYEAFICSLWVSPTAAR